MSSEKRVCQLPTEKTSFFCCVLTWLHCGCRCSPRRRYCLRPRFSSQLSRNSDHVFFPALFQLPSSPTAFDLVWRLVVSMNFLYCSQEEKESFYQRINFELNGSACRRNIFGGKHAVCWLYARHKNAMIFYSFVRPGTKECLVWISDPARARKRRARKKSWRME